MRLQIPTTAVLAASALLQAPRPQGVASESAETISLSQVTVSKAEDRTIPVLDDAKESAPVLKIHPPVLPEWTYKEERRFLKLAEREALGKIIPTEKTELEKLSDLRYQINTPRSGEQILLEYRQRQLAQELTQALNRYVEFQKATGYSGA